MPKKDDYRDFQERMFQEIKDLEYAELNEDRKRQRWAISIGSLYGFSEAEILDLRKSGMGYVEWLRRITEAGKIRRSQESDQSR